MAEGEYSMKTKRKQAIAIVLISAAGLVLCSPQTAFAFSFTKVSASAWQSTNTDTPGGWPYSAATQGGLLTAYTNGPTYNLQAVSSASGYIYNSFGTSGKGAGGHHQEFWDIVLQLDGDTGTSANLYFNSDVWGEVDVIVAGLARAFAVDKSTLLITNGAGTPLLDYYYTWSEDKTGAAVIIGRNFEDNINSKLLGTMIVGDPVWGSIRIQGNQYATATAQAKTFLFGQAEADIVSRFNFDLTVSEAPISSVPEPNTALLLGIGLAAVAGADRKHKFNRNN
jgi:hypothetical protein